MAIYNISELDKTAPADDPKVVHPVPLTGSWRDHLFSSFTARLFFLLLLVADLIWAAYSLLFFAITLGLTLATLFKVPYIKELNAKRWLIVKRTLVCAISLGITLFSPSFGIMIACTYFLMYDKSGIEEVVPTSLQSQFKEFFKSS